MSGNSGGEDVGSMFAAKRVFSNGGDSETVGANPSKYRDGFHLISNAPIDFDADLTKFHNFTDITYELSTREACARIAIDRAEVRNAFRPKTVMELRRAVDLATDDVRVAVVVLATSPSRAADGTEVPSFCAGGDQSVRSTEGGYDDGTEDVPRLRVLDLQVQMRRCPKPIIAVVRGYAVGGGHILHMVADLTIAATDAVFGQTGPRVGSFDAGYGCTQMARLIGQKRAREMWFLCRFYDAREALEMGLINAVCDPASLEGEVGRWVRRIVMNSPTAIACTKAALNADTDGSAGLCQLGGQLTRLFYMTDEGKEGRDAFIERRPPKFRSLPQSRL